MTAGGSGGVDAFDLNRDDIALSTAWHLGAPTLDEVRGYNITTEMTISSIGAGIKSFELNPNPGWPGQSSPCSDGTPSDLNVALIACSPSGSGYACGFAEWRNACDGSFDFNVGGAGGSPAYGFVIGTPFTGVSLNERSNTIQLH